MKKNGTVTFQAKRKRGRPRLTMEQLMTVEEARDGQCGVTVAAIAEEFGCSPRTVWRQLRRAQAERDHATKLFAQISPEIQAQWDAAIASLANWVEEYERAQQDDCGAPEPKL
jgi:hypothetical protein